jgi:hypothetical protein
MLRKMQLLPLVFWWKERAEGGKGKREKERFKGRKCERLKP